MANSKLSIVFNEVIPVGGVITFTLNDVTVSHVWVQERTGAGEVTSGSTINQTISNYSTALLADFGNIIDTVVLFNKIEIVSDSSSANFFSADSNGLKVVFKIINTGQFLNIINLTGNNYLINNPIRLTLQTPYPVPKLIVTFENLTNQVSTNEFVVYPQGSTATLDISPIIKSLFTDPNHLSGTVSTGVLNLNTIKITANFEGNETPSETTKSFIRGGNRTFSSNQTIPLNRWLHPTDKFPKWAGYSINAYYLETVSDVRKITTKTQSQIPAEKIDFRRTKGCNQVYVKFLNQMGGYSFWLFDTHNETESNNNLGSFVKNNLLADLGNEATSKIQVSGKIPEEYIQLMKDLAVSPEIYIRQDEAIDETGGIAVSVSFMRVISDRNPVMVDDNKRSYNVKFTFLPEYRFNPSLLWSN